MIEWFNSIDASSWLGVFLLLLVSAAAGHLIWTIR